MLGRNLKVLRSQNGITQTELAKVLGVSQQTVGSWEKDKSTPNYDLLKQIARYFKVTTDYLLGYSKDDDLKGNGDFSDDEIDLFSKYRDMDSDWKAAFTWFIKQYNPREPKSSTFPITKIISQKNKKYW